MLPSTLENLIHYMPVDPEILEDYQAVDRSILKKYKDSNDNSGHYYLAGQIRMTYKDEITVDKIEEALSIGESKLSQCYNAQELVEAQICIQDGYELKKLVSLWHQAKTVTF
jgi:hypothetical protein